MEFLCSFLRRHFVGKPTNAKSLLFCQGTIDLFTDTAAILNLLDLRSIVGCPGSTCWVFTNFNVYFSGKRRSLLHPNTAQRSFFSYYNLFLGKLKEKLARKARVNTDASISDRALAPGHPIKLLKAN